MVAFARVSSSLKKAAAKSLPEVYVSTLGDMFKATKLPSRHTTSVNGSTDDIFSERRAFFQEVFRETKLLGICVNITHFT